MNKIKYLVRLGYGSDFYVTDNKRAACDAVLKYMTDNVTKAKTRPGAEFGHWGLQDVKAELAYYLEGNHVAVESEIRWTDAEWRTRIIDDKYTMAFGAYIRRIPEL